MKPIRLRLNASSHGLRRRCASDGNYSASRWSTAIGLLNVGEASVVIAVSSAHRADAFEASAYAIQRIKEIVPVWKKEFYDDGETWIGSESDYQQLIAVERQR